MIRVAVPRAVRALAPRTGHGRVWSSVLPELERLVKFVRFRPDVWLADGHGEPPPGDLPVVAFMSEAPWRRPDLMADVAPEFAALLEARSRASAERAARIVCPSRAAADQIREVFGVREVDVVHHGVSPVFAAARPAQRDRPYVRFASQVHPRKNLAALREAMPPGLDLVVVGAPAQDREDSSALMEAALAPPAVAVDAPTDEALAALMAGCAVFCLPSLWEGFGLTALEAMAAGAPVVVSDRGALPEVVGDAGIVVAPDPAAIAAGLEQALADADRLRAAARARAAEFTWERTARGWLAALERAAAS